MLPHEPESLQDMKLRFHEAIAETVDIGSIEDGKNPRPGEKRRHVFDFDDGMRIIVSRDKSHDTTFLHVSASGNADYVKTIRGEGLDGLVEDTLIRLSALQGYAPDGALKSYLTEHGVLHIVFKEDENGNSEG